MWAQWGQAWVILCIVLYKNCSCMIRFLVFLSNRGGSPLLIAPHPSLRKSHSSFHKASKTMTTSNNGIDA